MRKAPQDYGFDHTFIRCECGLNLDFTTLKKCPDCGTVMCAFCPRRFRDKSYCKADWKRRNDEASRIGLSTLAVQP